LVVNLFWPIVINKTIIITNNIIIINVPLPTALLCLCCGIWIRQHINYLQSGLNTIAYI